MDRPSAPPRGFRDILPTEARELRLIERALTETFAAYGYMPLEPPMLEYAADDPATERLIQFLDRDGSLVALRPDLTTAVARLVGQRYRDTSGALRLSYFAPVFREQPAGSGGERQVVQAGVELIGAAGALADAEVLALVAESLERCGLPLGDASVHVGHAGLAPRLFTKLPEVVRNEVLSRLREGDLPGALQKARDGGMPPDALSEARELLAALGPDIERAHGHEVDEIRDVIHLARERWPGSVPRWGVPNLGLVPALPYYTGIVFEALHGEVGVIASGGRYDLLIGAFGRPRPATGFAIDVLRLHRALFATGWRPPSARPLVTLRENGDAALLMRCAATLRAAGVAVAIGDVAESAGLTVVPATVVDEQRVRLANGRVVGGDELARDFRS